MKTWNNDHKRSILVIILIVLTAFSMASCGKKKSDNSGLLALLLSPRGLTFNVAFDSQGGTSVTDQVVVDGGHVVEPIPPAKAGYTFGGWYVDSSYITEWDFDNDIVTEAFTLYAKWDTYSYTVGFDSQGATVNANPTSKTVASPATTVDALPTAPTRSGYYFSGWYTGPNGTGTEFIATTPVTGNITVYALWSSIPSHTVTFDNQGATTDANPTSISVVSPSVNVGTLPTAPLKTGYNFGGWWTGTGGGGTQFLATTTVSGNITVFARWDSYSYTVTYNSQGGSAVADSTVASPATTVGSLPSDPTLDGYTFGGWWTEVDGGGTQFNAGTTVTDSITVFANWVPNENTITFNANGGTGSMDPQVILTGVTEALTTNAYTREGYSFDGWATTETGPVEYLNGDDYPMGIESVTLFAIWTANDYTVSFAPNGGEGTMDPQTIACDATEALTLNAFTRDGYTFAGWASTSGGSVVYADGADYTMGTESVTLYAKWTALPQWSHQAYLKAPNNSNGDNFGWSVSIYGDTIAVGANLEDSTTTEIINGSDLSSTNDSGSDNGAVYVFTRTGTTWSHQAYLKAPNNSENDQFSYSVSISGDTIAVGVRNESSNTTEIINGTDLTSTNDSGSGSGAVYVFARTGTTWSHQAYLKAPNNSNSDQFGMSVSISGDTIAVGANCEDSTTMEIINGSDLSSTNNGGSDNGTVYVFTRTGTTWSHQAYLKAPNNTNHDQFGNSVSISGDTIAVGAWNEASSTTAIINSSDLSSTNNTGSYNGAVYVFTRTGTTWSHQAYLKAPNSSSIDFFGTSVSISGDTIAVGTGNEASTTTEIINGSDLSSTNNTGSYNGAVYVFIRTGATWSHQAYLKAPNNSNNDSFGSSLSIFGDTIAVGAPGEPSTTTEIINSSDLSSTNDSGYQNGAVYVFVRIGTTWSHQAYLKAYNNSGTDYFGRQVAIYGDTIAVGAPHEDSTTNAIINGSDLSSTNDSGDANGAVYVFTRQ